MLDLKRDGRAAQQRAVLNPIGAVRTLLLAAACAAAACLSLPVHAQQTTASTDQPSGLEEVVITGSRIPVPANITSTSPIASVTSQDITLAGQTDITDTINNLPQNIVNSTQDFGNHTNPLTATGGISTADLRGLGPQRTLVLVNGRRLGVGDASTSNANPAPDLDQIPTALVEKVDVVTGGASAVYGSDAMAGVVNFVMKKNFEGIQIDGQYDFSEHNDGDTAMQANLAAAGISPIPSGTQEFGYKRDMDLILGTNIMGGAGNITTYFVYHNQDPVTDGQLDYADCLLATSSATSYGCANSSNSNRFTPTTGPNVGTRYTIVGSSLLKWPQAGSSPPALFNSSAYEYAQRQDERFMGGSYAHLDISDALKPYLEVSFMNDRTNQVVGPSALFVGGNPYTGDNNYLVNCSNPLLSAQEQGVLCSPAQITADTANPGSANADISIGRRNIEGGGRAAYYEHVNYRAVGGLEGNLGEAWSYDAYDSYYYTTFYNNNANYLNYQSIGNAFQVTGTAANPVCISGSPCVPYNIWTQGGVNQQQLQYLYTPGSAYGTNTEQILHADFTGDLGKYNLKLPTAHDGLAVNAGVEYRFDEVDFLPDGAEIAGNLAGFSGAVKPLNAGYDVKEGFFELRAPILQDMPGAHDLTVDAGYRYSDYSTSAGNTNTYKIEIQYAPIPDFRLRYSYDRAVRAPNLIDLYNPASYGETSVQGTDPCASLDGHAPATASLAACERTGVTPAQYGTGANYGLGIPQCVAGQCGQVIGGNANLKPELGDTYSLGFTITPSAVPGFSATVDYWHVLLLDVIGTIPANVLFDGCLNGTTLAYCSDITRNPVTGALFGATVAGGGWINQLSVNTASTLVSGIDVQLNYHYMLPAAWGSLTASLNGSWLQHDITVEYPGATPYDCAGLFGVTCNNAVNPSWRHTLRLSWQTPWPVLASLQWRYIGSTSFDNNSSNSVLQYSEEGSYDAINAEIPSYSYLDLSAIWHVYKGIDIHAGVNNVLDKEPPVIPSLDITQTGAPNTYPSFDLLGREIYVGFRAKF
jgi:outer membrane receptor protein involved in Fe transport